MQQDGARRYNSQCTLSVEGQGSLPTTRDPRVWCQLCSDLRRTVLRDRVRGRLEGEILGCYEGPGRVDERLL